MRGSSRTGRVHHADHQSHADRRHIDGRGRVARRPVDRDRSARQSVGPSLSRRRSQTNYTRPGRSAPADVVARQRSDRVPGLRRWDVAHLSDFTRRRRAQAGDERHVRRPRARLVARRPADRVLVGPRRRRLHDLAGDCRDRRSGSGQHARGLDAVLVAQRSGRPVRLARPARVHRVRRRVDAGPVCRRHATARAAGAIGEGRPDAIGARVRPEQRAGGVCKPRRTVRRRPARHEDGRRVSVSTAVAAAQRNPVHGGRPHQASIDRHRDGRRHSVQSQCQVAALDVYDRAPPARHHRAAACHRYRESGGGAQRPVDRIRSFRSAACRSA